MEAGAGIGQFPLFSGVFDNQKILKKVLAGSRFFSKMIVRLAIKGRGGGLKKSIDK